MSRDHRNLRAFQLADDLVIEIYKVTRQSPPDERFGLTSQIRRGATSVAANIVEGCGRTSEKEFRNFLNIAFGSRREVGYLMTVARRLDYMPAEDGERGERIEAMQSETARVLAALMRSVSES